MASLCSTESGAQPAGGVFKFPALGAPLCSPPAAPPIPQEPRGAPGLPDWLDSIDVSKPDLAALPDSKLVVLCINAGGLADKLHKLIALLFLVEPDVVLVQEVWTRFKPSSVGSTPYHAEVNELYDGGGLLTLIHVRHKGSERPQVKRGRHHLCVAVQATPKSVLSIANIHFPPEHTADQRHTVVQAVAAFAKKSPGVQILGET